MTLQEQIDMFLELDNDTDRPSLRTFTKEMAQIIRKQSEMLKMAKDALGGCLEWMELLRVSGDAGFWEWGNCEYTTGKQALAKIEEMEK